MATLPYATENESNYDDVPIYNAEDHLDFSICAGEFCWRIDSELLAQRSSILDVARYDNLCEGEIGWIDLQSESMVLVCRLLQWLHTGDYSLDPDKELHAEEWWLDRCARTVNGLLLNGSPYCMPVIIRVLQISDNRHALQTHALPYAIAERYGMEALQTKVCDNVGTLIHDEMSEDGEEPAMTPFWVFFNYLPKDPVADDELLRDRLADLLCYVLIKKGKFDDRRLQILFRKDPAFAVLMFQTLNNHVTSMEEKLKDDKQKYADALRVIRKTAKKALKGDNVVATGALPIGVTVRASRGGWRRRGARGGRGGRSNAYYEETEDGY